MVTQHNEAIKLNSELQEQLRDYSNKVNRLENNLNNANLELENLKKEYE